MVDQLMMRFEFAMDDTGTAGSEARLWSNIHSLCYQGSVILYWSKFVLALGSGSLLAVPRSL